MIMQRLPLVRGNSEEVLPLARAEFVVLSGPITGVEDYRDRFGKWEAFVRLAGAKRVFNPAALPKGWEYEDYMSVCLMFVRDRADVLFQMPGWRASPGAWREYRAAMEADVCVLEVCHEQR